MYGWIDLVWLAVGVLFALAVLDVAGRAAKRGLGPAPRNAVREPEPVGTEYELVSLQLRRVPLPGGAVREIAMAGDTVLWERVREAPPRCGHQRSGRGDAA